MKSALRLLALACALVSAVPTSAAALAVPFRKITFDEAVAAATAEGKVVFIDFFTTWCGPCKMLDAQTFTDAAVGKLVGEKAVAIKLDAEKEGRALAQRFKVTAYPTLLLVKPDGTEIDRIIGFREPARFQSEFADALAGRSAIARARQAVQAAGVESTPEAVRSRFDLGRTLAQRGENEGALREFLWCFDIGMVLTPSFAGVRTSFLLSDLGRLARAYPPARDALLERCAQAESKVLADAGSRGAVTEFAGLCTALGDEPRMMSVFDSLPRDDARRRGFGLRAFRVLLKAQRYGDALTAMPFDAMERLVDVTIDRPLPVQDPKFIEINRRNTANSILDYIEVLAGAGERKAADTLIAKLKKFDASEEVSRNIELRLARAQSAGGTPN